MDSFQLQDGMRSPRNTLASFPGSLTDLFAEHERNKPVLRGSGTGREPVTCPRRITVIRSAQARTSFNLWVMKTTAYPSRRRLENTGRALRFVGGRLRVAHRG